MKRRLIMASTAVLVALTGCANLTQVSLETTPSATASDSAQFSGFDQMFAQMMIPHHQQAITMSDMALVKSSNPDILSLAAKIKAAQGPEITQMESWITSSLGGDHSAHGGHMGMLSEADIAELEAASGAEFDRLFLLGMIVHHEGAILMTDMIIDSSNPEVRELAQAIVTGQTAEIELMRALLQNIE